jgi:hypothetical protein
MNHLTVAKSLHLATNRLHPIHKWVCKKSFAYHTVFCSVIGEISVKLIGKLLDWICMSRCFQSFLAARARVFDFSTVFHFFLSQSRLFQHFPFLLSARAIPWAVLWLFLFFLSIFLPRLPSAALVIHWIATLCSKQTSISLLLEELLVRGRTYILSESRTNVTLSELELQFINSQIERNFYYRHLQHRQWRKELNNRPLVKISLEFRSNLLWSQIYKPENRFREQKVKKKSRENLIQRNKNNEK